MPLGSSVFRLEIKNASLAFRMLSLSDNVTRTRQLGTDHYFTGEGGEGGGGGV